MSGKYISKKIRKAVVERAFARCEYCQSWMKNAIHPFNIDHVIPLDKGGNSTYDNLAYSCGGCNSFKATRIDGIDPVTQSAATLFNPRKDNWTSHFTWSDDYLEVIGLTPTGRATVEALRLNRSGLINMRKLTKIIGDHPPAMESSHSTD